MDTSTSTPTSASRSGAGCSATTRRCSGSSRRPTSRAGSTPATRRRCGAPAASPPTAGVVVGAQVGYRDLAGFGRRFVDVAPDELADDVVYQIGALDGMCRVAGHGRALREAARRAVQRDRAPRGAGGARSWRPSATTRPELAGARAAGLGVPAGGGEGGAADGAGVLRRPRLHARRDARARGRRRARCCTTRTRSPTRVLRLVADGGRHGRRRQHGRGRGRVGVRPRRLARRRRDGPGGAGGPRGGGRHGAGVRMRGAARSATRPCSSRSTISTRCSPWRPRCGPSGSTASSTWCPRRGPCCWWRSRERRWNHWSDG